MTRAASVIAAALAVAGCHHAAEPPVGGPYSVPPAPSPMPGQASLGGHVVDETGQGIAGATVGVAETGGAAITDGDGLYALAVPSDSTLTLFTTAPGFAPSFRESVVLASQAAVQGFDLLLLPGAELGQMNALAPPDQAGGGLVAVRLHSMSPDCVVDGAHLAVWPAWGATVVYSRPADPAAGGIDQPDPTLGEVQPGTAVAAWLAGAQAPAGTLAIAVDKPGCQLAQPPSLDGLVFAGSRRIAPASLTEADLFLDGSAP